MLYDHEIDLVQYITLTLNVRAYTHVLRSFSYRTVAYRLYFDQPRTKYEFRARRNLGSYSTQIRSAVR